MGEYSKFISEKRRSVPTPKDLVDENGKVVFGTFDKEFETICFEGIVSAWTSALHSISFGFNKKKFSCAKSDHAVYFHFQQPWGMLVQIFLI